MRVKSFQQTTTKSYRKETGLKAKTGIVEDVLSTLYSFGTGRDPQGSRQDCRLLYLNVVGVGRIYSMYRC